MRPPNTRAKRAENRRILAASNVCHICGEPGADAVDHVIPLAKRPDLDVASNKRPAHHDVANSQGIKCNRVKGDKDYAPIIRRSGSLARP